MTTTPTRTPSAPLIPARPAVAGGVGESVRRPDGVPKVQGQFVYSSDLWAEGMLWGATARSSHPYARLVSIDVSAAQAMPGVESVLTARDVPGRNCFGLEHADQPVLVDDITRFKGEPVAIVAADHPETARRAAEAIVMTWEVLTPLTDPERARDADAPELHEGTGNVTRYVPIRHGDPHATADVVVEGTYTVGMQDQAFLGPESGLAIPDADGGVDLYISTQWLHVDQSQLAVCLGLETSQVRLHLAGVGGAFGAREDLSIQSHCCMLALATGRPVKMMYSREESFYGHVHRHPARMTYRHGATRDGDLVFVHCDLLLDGGAYASSSTAVCANAACFACGPYNVPNAIVDSTVVYTNNPPCGAMRGFGAVQVAVAHEAQMDKLADALDMDPIDLRIRNAMDETSVLPTGQGVMGPTPVRELLELVRDMPAPNAGDSSDVRALPGGASNTTHGEGVQRGVGYGLGFKNVCFAEGFDDYSTARVLLDVGAEDGEPVVYVHTAGAEVGQGLVMVQMQIARTELGLDNVVLLPADTNVGSAGSTSASRQSYMTGGAVQFACQLVRAELNERASRVLGVAVPADAVVINGDVRAPSGESIPVADLLTAANGGPIEFVREFRHRETVPLDPETGQGDAHVQFAFAAHRATVDVDVELGLVKVVEMATAQDVGKALNPLALEGQIEGGTSQGLGLAVMEEIQVVDGSIRNPSFTDYLIPTILDMPPVGMHILEYADPEAPYGLRGVGEPPNISSTPAVAAAIRAATGKPITHVPVRPDHIVGV